MNPCITTCPASVPTDEDDSPDASSAIAEPRLGVTADRPARAGVGALDARRRRPSPAEWKMPAAVISMAMLTSPAIAIAMMTSIQLEAEDLAAAPRRSRRRRAAASAPSAGRSRAASRWRPGCRQPAARSRSPRTAGTNIPWPSEAGSGWACTTSKANPATMIPTRQTISGLEVPETAARLQRQDAEREHAGECARPQKRHRRTAG